MVNKIHNMNDVDMGEEEEDVQGWDEKDTTVVAELSLTQHEVGSMRYVFNQWLSQYSTNEHSPLKKDIQGLLGALNEL